MDPALHLIIHNVLAGLSAVCVAAMVVFLLMKGGYKKTPNLTLALTGIGFVIFVVSHAVGVSIADPLLSRDVLMGNVVVILIAAVNFHCVLAVIHRDKENRLVIWAVYILAFAFTAFHIAFPDTFLLPSVPKMYFPSYSVPGTLRPLTQVVWSAIVPIYFIIELVRSFRTEREPRERNRIMYFAIALVLAWVFSSIPLFLIWGIPVDPAYGIFSGVLFMVPFTYAILKYELLDIRVVARQAFLYSISIVGIGGLILGFDYSNRWIALAYPAFPVWAVPLVSAIILVVAAVFFWRKVRQSDVLKYEFITTATHKFRTPLTHIKWASEGLRKAASDDERREELGYIDEATGKLVELTNVLMNLTEEEGAYDYKMERIDLSAMARETVEYLRRQAESKKITVSLDAPADMFVMCDETRIKFIVQTFIENAIHYTPENGSVAVSVRRADSGRGGRGRDRIVFSVKDTGIGIAKEDAKLLFTKFYRGASARLADTEGLGIGLYVSKGIIAKHHGRIWADSEGAGKGSAFSFELEAFA